MAKPGEILVSTEVHDAIQTSYPQAEEQAMDIKGLSTPMGSLVPVPDKD
ncbi:MAG: hypothetical protein IH873_03140 [Chloroflexi bacterium]|nr:hypothetical protein [Chloroflexota bacterium]